LNRVEGSEPLIAGADLVEKLEWDSRFFGFGVGRIRRSCLSRREAADCVLYGRQERLRCIYFLAEAGDPESWAHAIAEGFIPVDVRIELESRETSVGTSEEAAPTLASLEDLPDLLRISENSFRESRFYRDPGFPKGKAGELFRLWVARGVTEGSFFTVLERDEAAVQGFLTGRGEGSGRGRIDLVAVASDHRGRGVGSRLLAAARTEFRRRDLRTISVATQGSNVAAQRLYQEGGFRTREVGIWFHAWP
jgi:dTDP-4-amino-4,6-dideoxy-D-galactose acyltransferase